MNFSKKTVLRKIFLFFLLFCTCLTATACFFDPDEAINLKDCMTKEVEVKENSTVFYFYYASDEHPIEDYGLINVQINYYVDYKTSMKKKTFIFSIPDDVQYGEQPYLVAEIGHALTAESNVYISVHGNYKPEDKKTENTKNWRLLLSIIIALALLIILWSVYAAVCDACYSNTVFPSFMWLGGLFIYIILAIIISRNWGTAHGSIILSSSALYFLCTLITYFKYKL